jgi:myosin protein heavy chain
LSLARRSVADAERLQAEAFTQKQAVEERLHAAEERVRDMQAKFEDGRDSSDIHDLRRRLADALEDEREKYQKDLAERDFTADQTRKKYQGQHFLMCLRCLITFCSSGVGAIE